MRVEEEATPVEIVRLPVRAGGESALLSLLRGHPYFKLDGLTGVRILVSSEEADEPGETDRPEVVLVLDWADREAAKRALASEPGHSLLEGVEPLLAGVPSISYYGAAA